MILTWAGAGGIVVWMLPDVMRTSVWQRTDGFLLIVLPFLLALTLAVVQSVLIRRGCARSLLLLCGAALLGGSPGAYLALSLRDSDWGFPAAMYPVFIGFVSALVGALLWGVRALVRQV